MGKIEKTLIAAQKFLAGLRSLPHFADLRRKQVDSISAVLQKSDLLSTEVGGKCVSILDSGIWGEELLLELQSLIAGKVSDELPSNDGRRSQQDFLYFPYYLTQDLYEILKDEKRSPTAQLVAICEHAARLGLRNPTEQTNACLIALVHLLDSPVMSPKDFFTLLNKNRSLIRKCLKQCQPPTYLLQLPKRFEDLPSDLKALAFPGSERPMTSQFDVEGFLEKVMRYPLRKTNLLAQEAEGLSAHHVQSSQDMCMRSMSKSFEAISHLLEKLPAPVPAAEPLQNLQLFQVSPKKRDASSLEQGKALVLADKPKKQNVQEELQHLQKSLVTLPKKKKTEEESDVEAAPAADVEEPARRGRKRQASVKEKKSSKQKEKAKRVPPKSAAKKAQAADPKKQQKQSAAAARASKDKITPPPGEKTGNEKASGELDPLRAEEVFRNESFEAKVHGSCKIEFYKAKSYIRAWHPQEKKYRMIVGSTVEGKHRHICKLLRPHVENGEDLEALLKLREEIMASL